MEENEQIKKVFISYSWTTPKHEEWVLSLAEKLTADGVEVIIDKWDLKKGQDKYVFMEQMVTDKNLDKVLIICDEGYCERANNREKGVGTETQIITSELYTKIDQRKFIPIIAQTKNGEFDAYMPVYMKSLIGINMSSDAVYEAGYEELLRDIYDKPRHPKPKRGKMPTYLEAESSISANLPIMIKTMNIHLRENRVALIQSDKNDFFDKFFEELDSFRIEPEQMKNLSHETIVDKIEKMKPLRDNFLDFLEIIMKAYTNDDDISEIIIEFLERIYSYCEYNYSGSYLTIICDHFKFIIWEIFIWINTICFKHKKYNIVARLTQTNYYLQKRYSDRDEENLFNKFNFYCESLEQRKRVLCLNRLSLQADLLIEREKYRDKSYKEDIVETDIILYYISLNNKLNWFPRLYIFHNRYDYIKFIKQMERKSYFDKVKILFNVNNVEEFKKLIIEPIFNEQPSYPNSFGSVPRLVDSINLDNLCKYQ